MSWASRAWRPASRLQYAHSSCYHTQHDGLDWSLAVSLRLHPHRSPVIPRNPAWGSRVLSLAQLPIFLSPCWWLNIPNITTVGQSRRRATLWSSAEDPKSWVGASQSRKPVLGQLPSSSVLRDQREKEDKQQFSSLCPPPFSPLKEPPKRQSNIFRSFTKWRCPCLWKYYSKADVATLSWPERYNHLSLGLGQITCGFSELKLLPVGRGTPWKYPTKNPICPGTTQSHSCWLLVQIQLASVRSFENSFLWVWPQSQEAS